MASRRPAPADGRWAPSSGPCQGVSDDRVDVTDRHPWGAVVRLSEGEDVALVRDGRFLDDALRREGLRRADVEAALRSQGWTRSGCRPIYRRGGHPSTARRPPAGHRTEVATG